MNHVLSLNAMMLGGLAYPGGSVPPAPSPTQPEKGGRGISGQFVVRHGVAIGQVRCALVSGSLSVSPCDDAGESGAGPGCAKRIDGVNGFVCTAGLYLAFSSGGYPGETKVVGNFPRRVSVCWCGSAPLHGVKGLGVHRGNSLLTRNAFLGHSMGNIGIACYWY